jgi:hypothetical protein
VRQGWTYIIGPHGHKFASNQLKGNRSSVPAKLSSIMHFTFIRASFGDDYNDYYKK